MTPRNAALLLLLTAVIGQGLLRWHARPDEAPGEVAFRLGDTTSLPRHREAAAARSAEVGAGEFVDVDVAGAGELARLPGVGPGLAKRIVAERQRGGPFGGTRCLDARVPGIGEGFLRRAGPHLRFSTGGCVATGVGGAGSALDGGPAGTGCAEGVDLNRATKAELDCLPGIGAARAESILAWRDRRGGFREIGELGLVPGVSERVVRGLQGRVRVGQAP
jgi:DNA uptake protein ComE-like DNA-binding protein